MDERSLAVVAELGYALMRAEAWVDARRVFEGLAAEAGQLETPWRALAVLALRQARPDDAFTAATVAHERSPGAPAPLVLRAEASLCCGRYEAGVRDLNAALVLPVRHREDLAVRAWARTLRRKAR